MTLQEITLQKITSKYTQQEFVQKLKLLYLRTDVSNYPLIDTMIIYYDTMFEIILDSEMDVMRYEYVCLQCIAFLDSLDNDGACSEFCAWLSSIITFGIEWVNGVRKIS